MIFFVFATMRPVFIRFLEEIEDTKKTYRNYLTFSSGLLLEVGVNLIKSCECKFPIKINLLKIDDDSKHLVAK